MSQKPKREVKAPARFQAWTHGDKHEPFATRNYKKKEMEEMVMTQMYQCLYREVKKTDTDKVKEKGTSKGDKNNMEKKEVKGMKKSNKENDKIVDNNFKLAARQEKYKSYQQKYREKAKEKREEEKQKVKKYQESYRKMKKNKKI